jgi:hypothetical protein
MLVGEAKPAREVVVMIGIRRDRAATLRYTARWTAQAALVAAAAVVLAACSGSARLSGVPAGSSGAPHPVTGHVKTDAVQLIGKIDADMGVMGTFTGKDGWPAVAPADVHVRAGATVTITIREYDDMVTPLADNSPFLQVMGGTETVNGKRVTSVSNQMIAHTFTVPALGINVPLPIAGTEGSMGSMTGGDGPTTVRFTFHAPSTPGTYLWLCATPCGTGPYGISGAMRLNGWMRGHLIVS